MYCMCVCAAAPGHVSVCVCRHNPHALVSIVTALWCVICDLEREISVCLHVYFVCIMQLDACILSVSLEVPGCVSSHVYVGQCAIAVWMCECYMTPHVCVMHVHDLSSTNTWSSAARTLHNMQPFGQN